jgi:hypothetical protein
VAHWQLSPDLTSLVGLLAGQAVLNTGLPRSPELTGVLRALVTHLHQQRASAAESHRALRALFRELGATAGGPEVRLCLGMLEAEMRAYAAELALGDAGGDRRVPVRHDSGPAVLRRIK